MLFSKKEMSEKFFKKEYIYFMLINSIYMHFIDIIK